MPCIDRDYLVLVMRHGGLSFSGRFRGVWLSDDPVAIDAVEILTGLRPRWCAMMDCFLTHYEPILSISDGGETYFIYGGP